MYQFFVEDEQIEKEYVTIVGDDVRHIGNVLRMRPGEEIRISNGKGMDFFCEIAEVTADSVKAKILERTAEDTELPNRILLFQAIPKGERMEYVIQKAVELGVYEIIPVEMKYCVVRLDEKKKEKKRERWQAIAKSAAKQAKRSRIAQIHSVMSYREAIEYARQCEYCLVPYENERGMSATREVLNRIETGKDISVIIGPEGGFSEEEIELARQDMDVISLGKRILRTDTAAVTVMSMLMLEIEMKRESVK
ncbi:MAG: 16S rRNA (uracil(1498)-N(3))-methyltransferase [Lachnospiraceae bacterium]|nr:16S rRNA (uracil(1498)-N(3))-methyltransferase [Lachnospiraceae bacterium]